MDFDPIIKPLHDPTDMLKTSRISTLFDIERWALSLTSSISPKAAVYKFLVTRLVGGSRA